jgi:hypothetical protein
MTHTLPCHELYPAVDRVVAEVTSHQAPDCPPLFWPLRTERASEAAGGVMAGAKVTQ